MKTKEKTIEVQLVPNAFEILEEYLKTDFVDTEHLGSDPIAVLWTDILETKCQNQIHQKIEEVYDDVLIACTTKRQKEKLKERRIETKSFKDNYIFPYVVGAAFAFGWTPCIGPVLGSIIALSASEATINKGALLLSFYSFGLAIPFILSGYYINIFLNTKKSFSKHYGKVMKTGGVILLATGILILTNKIQVISYYILTTFPFLISLG